MTEKTQSPEFAPQPADDGIIPPPETGGRGKGKPDPTRYGDWEEKGKCVDFS